MTASLHLADHRPGAVVGALGATRRRWSALLATPGLAMARVFALAELDTTLGGTPRPTRWGLLLGWHDPSARDAFLDAGADATPLLAGAREACSIALETVRVTNGAFAGWTPSVEGVERLDRGEPVAVMTYGRLRARHVWDFTRDNRRIVRELAADHTPHWRLGMFDHAMARATFSLWPDQGSMVRFSYGLGTLHKPVQQRALAVPWGHSWFFARFRPVASRGTWAGADPLAAVRAPSRASRPDAVGS